MTVTAQSPHVDLVIQFPDSVGQRLRRRSDANDFVVKATQAALEKQMLAQELAESAAQADRGEYADEEELKKFFDKWNADEG